MIKPIILILAAATTLSACNTLEKESVPMTGMPNPASEFCVKQGGKLEIKKDKDGGEYGMCHLPDGIYCCGRVGVFPPTQQISYKS